ASGHGKAGGIDLERANTVFVAARGKQKKLGAKLACRKSGEIQQLESAVIVDAVNVDQSAVCGDHKHAKSIVAAAAGEEIGNAGDFDGGYRVCAGKIERAVIADVIRIRQRAVGGDFERAYAIVGRRSGEEEGFGADDSRCQRIHAIE